MKSVNEPNMTTATAARATLTLSEKGKSQQMQKIENGRELCYCLTYPREILPKMRLTVRYGEDQAISEWTASDSGIDSVIRRLFEASVTPCTLSEVLYDLGYEGFFVKTIYIGGR